MAESDTKEDQQEPSIEEILASIRQIISDDDAEPVEDSEDAPVESEVVLEAEAETPTRESDVVLSAEEEEAVHSALDSLEGEAEEEIREADVDLSAAEEEPAQVSDLDLAAGDEDDVLTLTQEMEEEADQMAEEDKTVEDQVEEIPEEIVEEEAIDVAFKDEEAEVEAIPEEPAPEPEVGAEEVVETEEQKDGAPKEDVEKIITENASAAALSSLEKLSKSLPMERGDGLPSGTVTLEDVTRDLLRPMLQKWVDDNLPNIVERQVAKEIEALVKRLQD